MYFEGLSTSESMTLVLRVRTCIYTLIEGRNTFNTV